MQTVALARCAMNTRFEILLHGEDAVLLRAAGEAALDEIELWEGQLSLFRPTSEISRVNRHAAERPVRVSPPVFRLLERAKELWQATGGAFDPSAAPLSRCWAFLNGPGQLPSRAAVAAARAKVGMHLVEMDAAHFAVRFARDGVMLDLGAIGKGYAIDCAARILREAGVVSAFLHGGTSSACGLGRPPDVPAWKTAIPDPRPPAEAHPHARRPDLLAEVELEDTSLGVSAVWGKYFTAAGRTYGHVIDPRTGEPVQRAALAAVVSPSATEADALSTALLVLGAEAPTSFSPFESGARWLVAERDEATGALRLQSQGIAPGLAGSCAGAGMA